MKVCIFGCKSTTLLLAKHVRDVLGLSTLVTIDPEKGKQAQVADYVDVTDWAAGNSVQCHRAKRYDLTDEEDRAFFAGARFDLGLVIGWQRLVPAEILKTFSVGVFGMHGSVADLPKGRGRSPMNWALIEGRKLFYTSLYKYDPGVDSGEIVDTMAFSIGATDTAETMHFKNAMAMVGMVRRNATVFKTGQVQTRAQADLTPTYYPKRSPHDSLIDWSMPIDVVERFIRAVAPPFNGAFTFLNDQRIRILRAGLFEMDYVPYGFETLCMGEIAEVFPNGKFLVKCCGGLLLVHDYEIADRTSLVPGGILTNSGRTIRIFATNGHGGYDLPIDGSEGS